MTVHYSPQCAKACAYGTCRAPGSMDGCGGCCGCLGGCQVDYEEGCRFCHRQLTDQQEIDWNLCAACYADGIAEQESNR